MTNDIKILLLENGSLRFSHFKIRLRMRKKESRRITE